MSDQPISIEIPEGYTAIPLSDVVDNAEVLRDVGGNAARPHFGGLLPTIATLLESLVANGTRYFGFGAHLLPDGLPLYSCLTISVTNSPGGPRNPRLVLSDLVRARSAENSLEQVALVETESHPVMFSEKIGHVVPLRAGQEQTTPAVYQLQAVVPSDDGTSLVAIELSSADAERAVACRKMIADMARTVVFRTPEAFSLNL
ncbi:hypothetical protein [Nocardia sp. NPDC050413]|uniref:hypothetical protein n=1 Tax=Nocardia sp. NPDC050413 TaxID=3155784 RepID=UPI00340B7EE6